jgi:myosin heavy subunit
VNWKEHRDYELGNTKLFIKEPAALFALDDERVKRLDEHAERIQRAFRQWAAELEAEESSSIWW